MPASHHSVLRTAVQLDAASGGECNPKGFKVEAALAERGIGSSREVRERGLLEGCAYLAVEHGRYDEAFEVMLDVLGHRPRQAGPRPAGSGPGRAEGPDGSP